MSGRKIGPGIICAGFLGAALWGLTGLIVCLVVAVLVSGAAWALDVPAAKAHESYIQTLRRAYAGRKGSDTD